MLFSFACEAAGAAKHPAFPAPSAFEGQRQAKLGRGSPREGGVVAVLRDAAFRPLLRMRSEQMATDAEAADPHGEEALRAVSNHEADQTHHCARRWRRTCINPICRKKKRAARFRAARCISSNRTIEGLVPTFRSSCSIAAPTFTNFGKSWALANLLILVPLYRSEVPDRIRRLWSRDFRSAVLV